MLRLMLCCSKCLTSKTLEAVAPLTVHHPSLSFQHPLDRLRGGGVGALNQMAIDVQSDRRIGVAKAAAHRENMLLDAEINAELVLQTTKDTTEGKEKPIGQRGAFVADHVAGGPEGHERPVSPVTANPGSAKRGRAKSRNRLPKSGSAVPS